MWSRYLLLSLLTVFAPVAASADSLRFDPPVATGHTSVDAIFSSITGGCAVFAQDVTVAGTTVTLNVSLKPPPGGGCGANVAPYTSTFHLGVLGPGVYDVAATADTLPRAHAKLIVRDDSLTAAPFAVPSTGGEFHVLRRFDTTGLVVVLVDGHEATFVREESPGNVYLAPPHAPGTVDVSVASASTFRTAVAALTYFDRAAPPDPALFELILFPTSFVGPGPFGSHWLTENYIAPGIAPVRFRDAVPCYVSCGGDLLVTPAELINDQSTTGLALFALRGMTSDLMTGSRIYNFPSGVPQNGTEVHVVRESDFRDRGMSFLTVPVDHRARVMLRAWALTDTSATVLEPSPPPPTLLRFVPVPGMPYAFASLDLTSYFQHLPEGTGSASIYFPRALGQDQRMWGMISVTNNDTQQVTIVSSQ
ncbi:MAG TPA: hypothetical protein VLC46_19790 [Thermoanaerobaculia bacterium]|jgi:hypothetical protein|nr:hypothetical protein [Thermoanaerobaculia bacterium]